MQNKILALLFIVVICSTQSFAAGKITKAKINPISTEMAKELISNQTDNIKRNNISPIGIKPDNNQCFRISMQSRDYYIVSTLRYSQRPTCAVLLFNESKELVNLIDTVNPDNDEKPWLCDHAKAMSFLDYYPDGGLKIIALYIATAPSSDRFTDTIIIKLDFKKPSLSIDEFLTSKFNADNYVETIKDARKVLKNNQ